MEITVEPVCVKAGSTRLRGTSDKIIVLREFQEELVRFFAKPKPTACFLSAPTGSGKTFTTLAPLLANMLHGTDYQGVTALYPTRALVYDQAVSVSDTLKSLGAKTLDRIESKQAQNVPLLEVLEVKFTEPVEAEKTIGLLVLTRESLDEIADTLKASGEPRRNLLKRVVEDLWLRGQRVDYLVAFAVPEYPYLLASRIYGNPYAHKLLFLALTGQVEELARKVVEASNPAELEKLRAEAYSLIREAWIVSRELLNTLTGLGDVIFLDEYHVWTGFEKPTVVALALSYMVLEPYITASTSAGFRLVFSSATPDEDIVKLVASVSGDRVEIIAVEPVECRGPGVHVIRGRTRIEIYPVETIRGPMGWLQVDGKLPEVVVAKVSELTKAGRFIVFGRRTSSVEIAARRFYEATNIVPTVVTGVKSEFPGREALPERRERGSLPLFGNYAVEMGIDLKNVRYGIVVASTPGELVQRAGRIGRGNIESKLVIVVPAHYADYIAGKLHDGMGYQEALKTIADAMLAHLPVEKLFKKLMNEHIGLLRVYAPLSSLIMPLLASDKIHDIETRRAVQRYLRVLNALGVDEKFKDWMLCRIAKTRQTLIGLASFRVTWNVKYIREGDEPDEASFSTLISNYDVELEGSVIRIYGVSRKTVSKVMEILTGDASMLEYLYNTILPSHVALRTMGISLDQQESIEQRILVKILERDDPIYIAPPKSEFELLVAYGYAMRIKTLGRGNVVGYLIPL